jgi:group I intron endonuclease
MHILSQAGIYAIGGPNGGIYVGSAVRFNKRWIFHKSLLRRDKHHSPHLQHAWNKYGPDCLHFEVLEIVDDVTQLYTIEQHYLDVLFSTVDRRRIYNVTRSADGATGRIHTPETRRKMSAFQRGRKRDADCRRKMSEGRKGMKFAATHCDNNALAKSGGKRYMAIGPDGTIYHGVVNIAAFARQHNAPYAGLRNIACGCAAVAGGWTLASYLPTLHPRRRNILRVQRITAMLACTCATRWAAHTSRLAKRTGTS